LSEGARKSATPTRRLWFVAIGAALGVALGILVSLTTDIPLAPEAGLLLGGLAGWFSSALRHHPLPR
jgi:hypothetical protein